MLPADSFTIQIQASPASLLQSLAFIEPSLQHSKQLPVPNYDELSEASQVPFPLSQIHAI